MHHQASYASGQVKLSPTGHTRKTVCVGYSSELRHPWDEEAGVLIHQLPHPSPVSGGY